MAVNSVSCACGGKNKKCFTCLVAGNVKPTKPKRISPVQVVVRQVKQSRSQEGEAQTYTVRLEEAFLVEDAGVRCADCGVMVKDLEKHRSKVHGVMVVDVSGSLPKLNAPAKAPTNPMFTLQKCAVCGAMVRDLAHHMKKAKHIDKSKEGSLLVLENESGELICPRCRSRWRELTELESHVQLAHGIDAAALRVPTRKAESLTAQNRRKPIGKIFR